MTKFRNYINAVQEKQKRHCKYNILDVLKVQLRSLRDGSKSGEEFTRHPVLRDASSGNISYWTSKIMEYDVYDHLFKRTVDRKSTPSHETYSS